MGPKVIDTSNILTQAAAYTGNGGGDTPVGITENNSTAQIKRSTTNFQSSFD